MISLLTFIQTGRLGDIGLGSTRTEVELAFGPPDRWDARFHFPRAPSWKYGNIEIHFDGEDVSAISTDDSSYTPLYVGMGDIAVETDGINGEMSVADGVAWLRSKGVAFKRELWHGYAGSVRLTTSSCVALLFSQWEGEELLFSISLARR